MLANLKKSLILLLVLFSMSMLNAQNLNALLSYATFDSPDQGPYIETYLSVAGNSVTYYLNDNNKYQAHLQVIMLFKQGEKIISFDKYKLSSPETEDTTQINFDFIDQQRFALANGTYDFEIQIWDNNKDTKPFVSIQPVEINYSDDKVMLSGIELIKSFSPTKESGTLSKNGYDLVPYTSNFYPESMNKLTYYAEVYYTDKILGENEQYLVSSYIQELNSKTALDNYANFRKQSTQAVNVIFSEFDISQLKSGNYYLVIEVRDNKNKLKTLNRIFFQRSNPKIKINIEDLANMNVDNTFAAKINNRDTLLNYIQFLYPIADFQEKAFIEANGINSDTKTLQSFFYKFWKDRDPLEPQKKWNNYLNEVNKVNLAYSTEISAGYETDRGRVYLKYGPPNAISESYNEPATYPYEIWHYYELENGQRNKKFVFYTKDIVTNDFVLLHSDVTGELANYRWQYMLYQRVDTGFDIDKGVTPDTWGGNSKRYFDLPR